MESLKRVERGDIKLEHCRSASVIKMTITHHEPIREGGPMGKVEEEVWLEYSHLEDLKEIINVIYSKES